MVFGVRSPAFCRVYRVGLGVCAPIVDSGIGRDRALGKTGERRTQFEDRTRRILGGNRAVVQRIIAVQQLVPFCGIHLTAVEHRKIVIRIAYHAQHAAGIGIHRHDRAGFRQRYFASGLGVLRQHIRVSILPAAARNLGLLRITNLVDGGNQRIRHHLFQFDIDGQHDGISVRGRGIIQFAHHLAARVAFYIAAALTIGNIGRKLILQRIFDARRADVCIGGVALAAVGFQLRLGNLAGVADDVARGAAFGVYARGAFFDVDAVQIHRSGFNFRNGFKAHVVGDGDRRGVKRVHARFLPQRQHLGNHIVVQIGGNAVFFAQRFEKIRFIHAAHIEVRAPLLFARCFHAVYTGTRVKAPGAIVVLFHPEIVYGGFAVRFNQPDGFDQHLRIGGSVFFARFRGIAVEGYVVAGFIVSQRYHVGIINRAALSVQRDRFFGFGAQTGLICIRVGDAHDVQPNKDRDKDQ